VACPGSATRQVSRLYPASPALRAPAVGRLAPQARQGMLPPPALDRASLTRLPGAGSSDHDPWRRRPGDRLSERFLTRFCRHSSAPDCSSRSERPGRFGSCRGLAGSPGRWGPFVDGYRVWLLERGYSTVAIRSLTTLGTWDDGWNGRSLRSTSSPTRGGGRSSPSTGAIDATCHRRAFGRCSSTSAEHRSHSRTVGIISSGVFQPITSRGRHGRRRGYSLTRGAVRGDRIATARRVRWPRSPHRPPRRRP
jgi:hypothetical protein